MQRVIFHIGPEKTGSTLIQGYIEKNIDLISDISGGEVIFYGPAAVRDSGLLEESQKVVGTGGTSLSGVKKLLAEAVDKKTVIISHESLFGHPDTGGFYGSRGGRLALILLLQKALESYNLEFVFYYKQPHILLESYYRHHVMHGGTLEVMEYLQRIPILEMSFVQMLTDMTSVVGEKSVTMLESRIDSPDNHFRRFCSALRLSVSEKFLTPPDDTNRTWSSLKVELMRLANKKMLKSEVRGWYRAMSDIPLGDASDTPLVPKVITDLTERVYKREDESLLLYLEKAGGQINQV